MCCNTRVHASNLNTQTWLCMCSSCVTLTPAKQVGPPPHPHHVLLAGSYTSDGLVYGWPSERSHTLEIYIILYGMYDQIKGRHVCWDKHQLRVALLAQPNTPARQPQTRSKLHRNYSYYHRKDHWNIISTRDGSHNYRWFKNNNGHFCFHSKESVTSIGSKSPSVFLLLCHHHTLSLRGSQLCSSGSTAWGRWLQQQI